MRAADPAGGWVSLAETAYRRVKRMIVTCELSPGQRFNEPQIAQAIGLGKTPIREGLSRLVHDGLVRSLPKVGYEVAPLTLGDVRDVFGLRLIMEPAAARLAAGRIDRAELTKLELATQRARRLRSRHGLAGFLDCNRDLHLSIAAATGNLRLYESIERLLDASERVQYFGLAAGHFDAVFHDHGELIDALARGDADAAHEHAAAQIVSAQVSCLEAFLANAALLRLPLATEPLMRRPR